MVEVPHAAQSDASFHSRTHVCNFGLAFLATSRLVHKLLLVKENLLASAEDELLSADNACQGSVSEFHCAYRTSWIVS